MRFSASLILFISTALLCSCLWLACSTPKMVTEQGEHLSIKESYIQKIVPGTQETLPANFLFITLNNYDIETVFIDSIHYTNRSYPIKKSKFQYKIDLSKEGVMSNNSKTKNIAKVFYSQHNRTYYLRIEELTRKETIYMP